MLKIRLDCECCFHGTNRQGKINSCFNCKKFFCKKCSVVYDCSKEGDEKPEECYLCFMCHKKNYQDHYWNLGEIKTHRGYVGMRCCRKQWKNYKKDFYYKYERKIEKLQNTVNQTKEMIENLEETLKQKGII